MAEILISLVNKPHSNVNLSIRHGDVICVEEDGHGWTQTELDSLNWTIVKIPGVTKADIREAIAGIEVEEIDDGGIEPKIVCKLFRKWRLKIENITPAVRTALLNVSTPASQRKNALIAFREARTAV